MTVAEPRRHHLYEMMRERFDEPSAETLFDMLDAIDTSGLATKADVSAIRADLERFATKADLERFATKADLSAIRADLERFATRADLERFATKADLEHLEARIDVRLERELRAMQSRFVTWLLASQAVVVASIGLATTALIAVLG